MSLQIERTWGVISDTHGLLRSEAFEHLKEVERILHAGDVGNPEVIERLVELAPVQAVRGNVDRGGWANVLPMTEAIEFGPHLLYLIHILDDIDLIPEAAGISTVIYGHTHVPKIEEKQGVTYFNPGSLGPRRFSLPVSMGRLHLLSDGSLLPELIELEI
ncbi:MAG TPA: metallophosphoesterase family protein [Planctomycetaceae bacterium]|nr:metallophosphoesterase family protein [Planctomycetaceae bacterium]